MDSSTAGFVYKWTNTVNGMWYIGSHKGAETDKYTGSGIHFRKALKKHGTEQFVREILYRGPLFREEEQRLLTELNAAADPLSYNLKNEAFGATLVGEANGMFGRPMSDESRALISAANHNRWSKPELREHYSKMMSGEGNPMFGKSRVGTFAAAKISQTKAMRTEKWRHLSTEKHHRYVFERIFRALKHGKYVKPRGELVLELENFSYVLPPFVRFQNFEPRKLNVDYIKSEMLWYLRGDKFDQSICEKAKMWSGLVNADGSFNSNYGQFIFGEQKQFDNVIQTLVKDRDSRRASIVILNSDHLFSNTKDVPCTYSMNFRIRDNALNMSVHMRSQDAIFGMGNDAPAFSMVHEMLLNALRRHYPELTYGMYHHSVDSFHVYERHFKMLDELMVGRRYMMVLCPKISGPDEVDFLRGLDYSNTPPEFEFTRWLTEQPAPKVIW